MREPPTDLPSPPNVLSLSLGRVLRGPRLNLQVYLRRFRELPLFCVVNPAERMLSCARATFMTSNGEDDAFRRLP